MEGEQGGRGGGGSSVMGGADEESCNADCGDLKQHRFEHSWGSQQRCNKCRLRSVHRGGPYVAPRRCLASTDIFQCLSAGIRAGNQYILRKGNVHIICQLGWMDRDIKGSLESQTNQEQVAGQQPLMLMLNIGQRSLESCSAPPTIAMTES